MKFHEQFIRKKLNDALVSANQLESFYDQKKFLSPRIKFKRSAIEAEVPEKSGIYILWLGKICLYVGQANNLCRRLKEHWGSCENQHLALYIRAKKGRIDIQCIEIVDNNLSKYEQIFIDVCKPTCNVINAIAKKKIKNNIKF